MKTAREVAHELMRKNRCGNVEPINHTEDCDRLTAAIEARDRELVEAAAMEAETAGKPCDIAPCNHRTCMTARNAAARIRAILPKEAP
jgi:hypothetical protein